MSPPQPAAYRIDRIEVDLAGGCVRGEDGERRLRPQTVQVLQYLLEHRDRTVSKEELRDAVWRDVAVTDDALVQCVVDIRKALGDHPRRPRYLRTIPKVGYRFVGPLEAVGGREEEGAQPATSNGAIPEIRPAPDVRSPLTSRLRALSNRRAILIGLAALLASVALAVGLRRDGQRAPSSIETTLPETPGARRIAVLSFDNVSRRPDLFWLQRGLAEMLITDLSRAQRISVLSGDQVAALAARIGLEPGTPMRLEQALAVARQGRAEAALVGSFTAAGSAVRVDVRIHDVRTGRLVGAERLAVDRPEQLLDEIDVLSIRIAERMGAPRSPRFAKHGLADVMTRDLQAYRDYVLALQRGNDLPSAETIALLQKAVARDSRFAMAYARIGYTYAIVEGYAERGRPFLERAFQLSDRLTERDRLYILAWYAISTLDYPAAIPPLRELLARYPDELEAYLRLGVLLAGEGQPDEALAVMSRGLVIDPESTDLYRGLTRLCREIGRYPDAVAAAERSVALAPRDANAHDELGLSYHVVGRYEEALKAYQRALQLNPRFGQPALHLGNLYFETGQYRAAIDHYRLALEVMQLDVERARGYDAIAWVEFSRGNLTAARQAGRRAIAHEPAASWHVLRIAWASADTTTARRLEAAVLAPPTGTFRGRRGLPSFQHLPRVYIALRQGRTEEALGHLHQFARQPPLIYDIEPIDDTLGQTYLQLGRLDEAVAEFQRILRYNPKRARVRFRLAQAYDRSHRPAAARMEYEKFLEIWKDADPGLPELVEARARARPSFEPRKSSSS